ncbi:hypothetical protein B0F90DRAFT_1820271 [Multifurca ochricompacta]|uniref:Uncharacterized protein n=1 Tax=Multifurca ochricompacta TaxID=376703 RepID=A0AAD4QJX6_9AGAM|nr:hypothetical protein B0F90DRAFT_1820271 [Multifurca ochricompacta]
MFGLWRLLYNQGLFWILLVTVAEIPPTAGMGMGADIPCLSHRLFQHAIVRPSLRRSIKIHQLSSVAQMFQTPELIMMAIGASRIYRSLADYTSMTEFNQDAEK